MRKLIYEGHILTNSEGLTDTWKLIIGTQSRVGSLFELRRQVNFHQELGVLPPLRVSLLTAKSAKNDSGKKIGKPASFKRDKSNY